MPNFQIIKMRRVLVIPKSFQAASGKTSVLGSIPLIHLGSHHPPSILPHLLLQPSPLTCLTFPLPPSLLLPLLALP